MIRAIRDTWAYECQVRPTYEWSAVIGSYVIAFCCLFGPYLVGALPLISYIFTVIWFYVGSMYAVEAVRHFRFLNGLWRIRPFVLHPRDLPKDDKIIFAGRGFRITPLHTQRLYELNNEITKKYSKPPAAYYVFRKVEKVFYWLRNLFIIGQFFFFLYRCLNEPYRFNPFPSAPVDILDPRNTYGDPYLHGVGADEECDIYRPFADSNSHELVLGTTRQGKTVNAGIMVCQDIHRFSSPNIDENCSVLMLDPKGDIGLAAQMFAQAQRAGKADKFYFFHLGFPHLSCRYNALAEFNRDTEVATRVTNPLSDSGNSKVFKDFAWQFTNIAALAVRRMGKVATFTSISKYLKDPELLADDYISIVLNDDHLDGLLVEIGQNLDKRDLSPQERSKSPRAIALSRLMQDPPEDYAELFREDDILRSICDGLKHDRSYYDKITASVKPHLDKINSGSIRDILSPNYEDPNDRRPIIDLRQIIANGGILYAGFDFMSDPVTGGAVGNAFLSEILAISGEIYKYGVDNGMPILKGGRRRKPVCRLHIDEANEIFGRELNPILNKAGGSGVSVVAYTQTFSDIEVKLEDKALANQAAGNFGTIISFKVRGNDTSTYLSELTPEVRVMTNTPDSRAGDGMGQSAEDYGQFKSSNADAVSYEAVPLIPEWAFRSLPKGEAYMYAQSQWYKVRMPIFLKDENEPKDTAELMRVLERERGYKVTNDAEVAA